MANERRIVDDRPYAHFITFSVDRRRKLFTLDYPKRILLGVLNAQLDKHSASCIGFVVMPEHVHAIVWFPKTNRLSDFMHDWKRESSYYIRNWYREHAANYFAEFSMGTRFWLPKYYAFEIETRVKLEVKLSYMHENPSRRGLVERAIDWRWSSARWYAQRMSVGVPITWIDCD